MRRLPDLGVRVQAFNQEGFAAHAPTARKGGDCGLARDGKHARVEVDGGHRVDQIVNRRAARGGDRQVQAAKARIIKSRFGKRGRVTPMAIASVAIGLARRVGPVGPAVVSQQSHQRQGA